MEKLKALALTDVGQELLKLIEERATDAMTQKNISLMSGELSRSTFYYGQEYALSVLRTDLIEFSNQDEM